MFPAGPLCGLAEIPGIGDVSERLRDKVQESTAVSWFREVKGRLLYWLYYRPLQWVALAVFLMYIPVRTAVMWAILLVVRHTSRRDPAADRFDVVCFSHVPWRHIWQRNHHTMTRLANARKVVYVEHFGTTYVHWFAKWAPWSFKDLCTRHAKVNIRHPLLLPGESRIHLARLLNRWILVTFLRWYEWRFKMVNTVLWFYYPAAVYVLEKFRPAVVVYDIQDEYTAFNWAPRDIGRREQQLLAETDVIFAGTHALYEKKREGFSRPAYFFPCAVEFDHFNGAAPDSELPFVEPAELAEVGSPRLIYMGLIDARIDARLIERLAEADPNWHIVMLGPVDVGLFDAGDIAERYRNVHFVGKIDYKRLPQFLGHSDVFIMPWMVNDLTRHINPTKTLEYLAAARPVVSINLPDLQAFFGDYVALASNHDEFVEHCRRAVRQQDPAVIARGIELAQSYSWETVVGQMESYVRDAMKDREKRRIESLRGREAGATEVRQLKDSMA
jgi:UDP-galactopyranose mutase